MKQQTKKTEFVDAQQMHLDHPDSFLVPTQEELDAIKPGEIVKVCPESKGERFWVIVTEVKGDRITGSVDNELIYSDIHGLFPGDIITFKKKNIYSIYRDNDFVNYQQNDKDV